MKKLIALLLICILILTGCADDSSSRSDTRKRDRRADDSTTTASITEPSTTEAPDIKHYPNDDMFAELIPEIVFTTTAAENGLSGTMCMIFGTVESFDVLEGTDYSYMWVDTITNGKIIVMDPVPGLCEQATASGWDIDKEKLRSLLPLPEVGEFAVIIAAYDGWSGKLECPMFVYGGEDYLVNALLESTSAETLERIDSESNESQPTPEQKSALKDAQSYLKVMAFSYERLIDQLEYEGHSTADATYAADNCGADWNEQAALKAESYMEVMTFTRNKLISQLKYEGFTQEQAEYGADSVGL